MDKDRLSYILALTCLVLTLALSGSPAVSGQRGQTPETGLGLFIDSDIEGDVHTADDPTVVRARFVNISFELLAGDALLLNLFEDASFLAVLEHLEARWPDSFTWIGHVEGVEHTLATLVVEDGLMAGNIRLPGALYQVRYVGSGVHAIYEIDQSAFPPEAEPIPVDTSAARKAVDTVMADDGSVIEVLVVYTAAARSAAGGSTAINALIDLAVSETNTSYANSGINQRLHLVQTQEVAYSESGFDWSTTLSRLRGTSDGYMDNVHTLRDTYCADHVVLIVNNTSSCGLAYAMNSVSNAFEAWAFSVVARTCATGYFTFAHELAHNMGAHHDWYVSAHTTPYPYAHGYVYTPDRWRTIMAYNTQCSDSGLYCTRLQYWSNPDQTYGGIPMGVAEGAPQPADNRKTLNNTAYTCANFRVSCCPAPDQPSLLAPSSSSHTCDTTPSFDWSSVGGATSYHIQVDNNPSFSSPETNTTTSASNFTPSSPLSPGTYYWRARASNDCGNGPWSAVWSFTIDQMPGPPGSPSPADSAAGVSTNADLDWSDPTAATSYDVYFGASATPPYSGTAPSSSHSLPTLSALTHYYWQIVAKSSCGNTPGPIWDFTTRQANQPPTNGTVSPSSGSAPAGQIRYFTTTWFDEDGQQDLKAGTFHISANKSMANNAMLLYNAQTNRLRIRNNTGTKWWGNKLVGSATVIQNKQAKVHCALTTVARSGNMLQVTWAIEFKPAFQGSKNLYLRAKDLSGIKTRLQKRGTWRIQ